MARSIWSTIQIAFGLYPPFSVANVFGNWLHGIDHRFRILLRVGALAVIWSLGYVEMIRFLTIKVLLCCRLSIDVPGLFVYGPLYNAGESRLVYGGVYMIGGYGEGYFYSTWMAA